MTAEEICDKLGIDESKVANIYPYGSRIYGTATETSDHDFIIVFKSALLESGSFRDNARSSEDKTVQGVCYSRGGFQDCINNYEIGALECMFLPEDKIIKKVWPFKIQKWDEKVMAKKIIEKASASWHSASMAKRNASFKKARKGLFQALRILHFGVQMKEYQEIVRYSECNRLHKRIMAIPEEELHFSEWKDLRNKLMQKLDGKERH